MYQKLTDTDILILNIVSRSILILVRPINIHDDMATYNRKLN